MRLSDTLLPIPSNLGSILSGNKSGIIVKSINVHLISNAENLSQAENDKRRFWDLETLSPLESQEKRHAQRDVQILQDFHDSFNQEDGRGVVTLPKKRGHATAVKS